MTSQQRRHDLRMLLLAVGAITLILLALSLPEPVHSTHIPDGAVSRAVAAPSLQPVPRVEELAAPAPTQLDDGGGISSAVQVGVASWYDDGPGLYAAVPSWQFGDDRYSVRVCRAGSGRCVTVTVRDFCGCPGPRIIDLSPAAFKRLAPLSAGLVRVRVTFDTGPVLPATDAP